MARSLPERLERIVAGVCQANGAGHELEYVQGYPALVNDEGLTRLGMASATNLVGAERVWQIPNPELGGEDFAFFSQRVPSMMFRLGVRNTARGIVHPVHHPGFDLDEEALPLGAAALARIALDYLNGQGLE